jgi:hypothetical protein
MTVVSKTGVPSFTPELPDPVIISKEAVGRDFFLHKCELIMRFLLYSGKRGKS